MGNHPARAGRGIENLKARLAPGLLLVIATLLALPAMGAHSKGNTVHKTADQYIAEFKRGQEFEYGAAPEGLVRNHKVAPTTLTTLRRELGAGTPAVRENIVRLLEAIGTELDVPRPDKLQVIRDHTIIRTLALEGFAREDGAMEAAAKVLLEQVRPADLATANDVYAKSLQQGEAYHLHLAVKAKTASARAAVERMAAAPEWRRDAERLKAIKIAQAALGNTAVEDEFIQATHAAAKNAPPAPKNRFYNVGDARDGTELAARLADLGKIGTRRSLLVACSFLRSTMKSYVSDVKETLVRHHALDAILYNYPDARVLNRPTTHAEWKAAEAFCIEHLGAKFDGPTPELPPAQNYPIPMPMPMPMKR